MNQSVLPILLALIAGAGAGALAGHLAAPSPAKGAPPAAARGTDEAALDALAQRTSALERELEALRLELADARLAPARAAVPAPADETAVRPVAQEPARSDAPDAEAAREAYDVLLAGGVSFDEAQELWKRVEASGKLDELIAAMEARAKQRGNDPNAQTELGQAYLQKVFRSGAGPETGMWASKADKAFDDALAIDDHHWDARFSKAISLSFWPPVFGKQPEAVRHFEVLVSQQESGPPQEGYADTYVLLGNLHEQMGRHEQALAVWRQGLSLYPNHPELQQKAH